MTTAAPSRQFLGDRIPMQRIVGTLFSLVLLILDDDDGFASACFATFPLPFLPPPPAPVPPPVCCPPLAQQFSVAGFENGRLTVTYNNDFCLASATVTCTAPPGPGGMVAAIVVNQNHFLAAAPSAVTSAAACDPLGRWTIGVPPLVARNLECVITAAGPQSPPPPPPGLLGGPL